MILGRVTQIPGLRRLWIRFPVGSAATRVRYDVWRRPHYAYDVYMAADLAKRLGLPAISVVECGVAGGKGLLELEDVARVMAEHFGIRIAVFGLDSGEGMPTPIDYRDLPYIWGSGFYKTDRDRLQAKLTTASLIIGDLRETIPVLASQNIAPIGFVSFDLDYYSSTKTALKLLEGGSEGRLPRLYCYFDETVWPELACHNEYIGELCAIREFNLEHTEMKLCPVHRLRNMRMRPDSWNDQIYVLHDFYHPLYCKGLNTVRDRTMAL